MKILILGATGATGQHLVKQALSAGHAVTAIVRDPAKVPTQPNLTIVKGDVNSATDLEPLMRGQDAVISALGPRAKGDPICATSSVATVTAMKKAGLKRVVWLSAGGVGDSRAAITKASFVFGNIILPLFLAKAYANHLIAEDTLKASGLDWTVLRPVQLVDKKTGNPAAAAPLGTPPPGLKISREDVAAFMLNELECAAHLRTMPILYA